MDRTTLSKKGVNLDTNRKFLGILALEKTLIVFKVSIFDSFFLINQMPKSR
jgi:hypothetical protein